MTSDDTPGAGGPPAGGPLAGLRVVELAGIGPAPFGCMVLGDLGADVVRVDRAGGTFLPDPFGRNRRRTEVDLKSPAGAAAVLDLAAAADVLVDPFRPGVAERLGIGPQQCLARNPGLVYARMTGWGQDGPLAPRAGHDIDYIALAGALEPLRRNGSAPQAPINLVGDFGGGGMLLVVGVLAALHERSVSGRGQVVDAAMVDGASLLMTFVHGLRAAGFWSRPPGENLLDGGVPWYDTYATSDGGWVAVGALEPQFFALLMTTLGLDGEGLTQSDPKTWPAMRARFTEVFASRSRDEWADVFAGSDACVSPVLTPWEARSHPHHVARDAFVDLDGVVQPAPAPRFDRTPAPSPVPPSKTPHVDAADVVAEWSRTT
ncbi:CaiB/BaiF CoA-transferase family protein [Kineosporia sp. A_224]|uniref:CaiB/BaiF CoA transferase family protein n=1 Tax=Kineosporia sp. A_224 TaxID=1962180 RepID=UPI000B4AB978|nr:CaiB/BaiF CoA-transferase family protein [Kineosporia sp. A_224]